MDINVIAYTYSDNGYVYAVFELIKHGEPIGRVAFYKETSYEGYWRPFAGYAGDGELHHTGQVAGSIIEYVLWSTPRGRFVYKDNQCDATVPNYAAMNNTIPFDLLNMVRSLANLRWDFDDSGRTAYDDDALVWDFTRAKHDVVDKRNFVSSINAWLAMRLANS